MLLLLDIFFYSILLIELDGKEHSFGVLKMDEPKSYSSFSGALNHGDVYTSVLETISRAGPFEGIN
jgi:hypothetical protein